MGADDEVDVVVGGVCARDGAGKQIFSCAEILRLVRFPCVNVAGLAPSIHLTLADIASFVTCGAVATVAMYQRVPYCDANTGAFNFHLLMSSCAWKDFFASC